MRKPSPASETELNLLLAELNVRQQEILERGRSENYLFVLYFTALGGIIIAGIAVLQSLADPGLTFIRGLSPTVPLVGAMALLALPVDLVHLAYGVEVRRVYLQTQIEPRLRRIGAASSYRGKGGFRFEQFDRMVHKGWPNGLIVVRTAFIWLPSSLLFGYYISLKWPTLHDLSSVPWWDWVFIAAGLAAVVYCNRTFFRMNKMILDALKDREAG